MEFIPDCIFARNSWMGCYFSEYSPAYIIATEDVRRSVGQFMPKNCNRVLTVAASGDHPLFCSLYGAKYVDTFDISYNAKCIMDIKTAALQCLDYSEYLNLLDELAECYDITNVSNIGKISKIIPDIEWAYLRSMKGLPVFSHGYWSGKDDPYLLNEQEYNKLREIVKKTYSFEMGDICCLKNRLTESYDFIHISNIFDYIIKPEQQFKILGSLLKHLNVGGRIVLEQIMVSPWSEPPFSNRMKINKLFGGVFKKSNFIKGPECVCMFERVR